MNLSSSVENGSPTHFPAREVASAGAHFSSPQRFSVAGSLLRLVERCNQLLGNVLGVQRQRRLQVTETVSLGEKRFVSIVSVDGVEYLIGGGTATLSLLTQLPEKAVQPKPDFAAVVDQAFQNAGQA